MNFKSLLSQLDQLNEATEKTKTGLKHTAEPGGYGRKDDEDEDGNKIKDKSAEKKGKGRPKKATSTSGEDKKYDFSAFGVTKGKDVKLPKHDKKKTKKHSIKEYLDQMYAPLNEMGITIKPMPGASQIIGADGKPMGTADAATANTIKTASEKGTLKLGGDEQVNELSPSTVQSAAAKRDAQKPGQMSLATQRKDPMTHMTNRINMNKRPGEMDEVFDPSHFAAATVGGAALGTALGAVKGRYDDMKHMEKDDSQIYNRQHKPRTTAQRLRAAAGFPSKNDPNVKIKEADQPPRDALASPLTMEAKKSKPDANKNGIPDYAEDGKGKNDLKKKKVKEGMEHKLKAAYHNGKAHGLTGGTHCGKNYEDLEEARQYHEGYKCGLDECYGQTPIQGYVGETTPVVNTMASYGAEEGQLGEADIEESPFSWAAKNTPKGDKFSVGGKEFVKNDAFAFEALDKQLNALLVEDKEVTEGMTVSISKGQQGSPDSVSVSAQDGEADQLLSVIKSAGLGLFGGDDSSGMSHADPMTVDNGGEPAEVGAGGAAIEVVDDHDGMMNLMKKLSGIGGGEQSAHGDEHSHDEESEETCESCGGMMEEGHSCSEGQEIVDEVESEDQMTYQMAEDNPPDSGAAEVDAEDQSVSNANAAAAAYNPSQDIDEGGDGGEASDVGNVGVEAGDAEEEMQADDGEDDMKDDMNEAEDETGEEAGKEEMKERMSESSFFNLYKKLSMLSEESTSEKDDKAEKAAKKVAKDIEYDEGHKGKDDDKAEKAGKKVKKDIEYDDKEDKKDKKDKKDKVDESYANSADDTFETDIDFMMNIISGGLNKRKSTGQTTIPVVASQLNRTVSKGTTDINESSNSVAAWKKLAGIK
jgi:hypothetical protein